MKKKVDFFIVGAPKCGTTALAEILDQNPNIVISKPKEPHYFSSDLVTGGYMPTSDADYERYFFPEEKRENEVWGEASVWHMYSEIALKRIRKYNPEAKIIVMVRDPARAAFSLHQQMIFMGWEDELDFPKAWAQGDARFAKENAPVSTKFDSRLISYRHAFDFLPQLERVYESFPEDQILVLRQGELKEGRNGALGRITAFVGASDWKYEASQVNRSLYIKNPLVAAVMRSGAAKSGASILKKVLGVRSLNIGRPSERFKPQYASLVHGDMEASLSRLKDRFKIDLLGSDT